MALINELTSGPAPAQEESLAGTLRQIGTGDPLEEFMIALIDLGDQKGVLDAAFSGEEASVEEQVDGVASIENQDTMSREDITSLVDKFLAVPPDQQQMLLDTIRQESPKLADQALAAIRMVKGRDAVP